MIEGQKAAAQKKREGLATAMAGPVTFDDLLVAIGKTQNRDAFIRLFEYYAPRVKSFLIKGGLGVEQADELAQETMLSVWQNAARYNPEKAGAATWIYAIARNKRIDFLRRKETPGVSLEFDIAADDLPPDEVFGRGQESKALAAALETLPAEQADLVRKAYFEDKSHSDIAKETSLPLGTVKSRLRLALDRLRKGFEDNR